MNCPPLPETGFPVGTIIAIAVAVILSGFIALRLGRGRGLAVLLLMVLAATTLATTGSVRAAADCPPNTTPTTTTAPAETSTSTTVKLGEEPPPPPELVIILDNKHGGTYDVTATASYYVASDRLNQKQVQATVAGGEDTGMPAIPIDAVDLMLDLSFTGIQDTQKFRCDWPEPAQSFPGGLIIIDLHGVWPDAGSAVERTTGTVCAGLV